MEQILEKSGDGNMLLRKSKEKHKLPTVIEDSMSHNQSPEFYPIPVFFQVNVQNQSQRLKVRYLGRTWLMKFHKQLTC